MAPRGIVAASAAATFSSDLVRDGLRGADRILPVTFLTIVGTVLVYALTARPAAAALGVVRSARTRPLLVGGEPWVVDLARSLRAAGLDVLMWAGPARQRDRIRDAGIELAAGELMAAATDPEARLEGVTAVLLLTDDDPCSVRPSPGPAERRTHWGSRTAGSRTSRPSRPWSPGPRSAGPRSGRGSRSAVVVHRGAPFGMRCHPDAAP
jgi:hypothetical protein